MEEIKNWEETPWAKKFDTQIIQTINTVLTQYQLSVELQIRHAWNFEQHLKKGVDIKYLKVDPNIHKKILQERLPNKTISLEGQEIIPREFFPQLIENIKSNTKKFHEIELDKLIQNGHVSFEDNHTSWFDTIALIISLLEYGKEIDKDYSDITYAVYGFAISTNHLMYDTIESLVNGITTTPQTTRGKIPELQKVDSTINGMAAKKILQLKDTPNTILITSSSGTTDIQHEGKTFLVEPCEAAKKMIIRKNKKGTVIQVGTNALDICPDGKNLKPGEFEMNLQVFKPGEIKNADKFIKNFENLVPNFGGIISQEQAEILKKINVLLSQGDAIAYT